MSTTLSEIKYSRTVPYYFAGCWAFILLANFLPSIPQPVVVIGYLWQVEFVMAAFLLLSIILLIKVPAKSLAEIGKTEFYTIILPLLLFTTWSGFSVLWAESARSAIHHTLLWACYLVFYLLICQVTARPYFLKLSINVSGIVITILGIACLLEYFTTSAEMSGNISLRYSKYAEAIATLLVLFVALAVKKRNSNSIIYGAVAIVGWLAIVFSLGRTQFIAGLFGVFVFAIILMLKSKSGISMKKGVAFAFLFVLITVFSQIFFTSDSNQTTLKRLSGDENSKISFQVRVLIWQIAFQGFKQKPLLGEGAENFAANYQNSRKIFSETNPNYQNLALYEEILPERAHNEFLQILAELGIIGAIIFIVFLIGILRYTLKIPEADFPLLSVAAFAGICAFLVSSLASSYSFRVPANGLCFFFVLALFVRGKCSAGVEAKISFVSLSRLRLPAFAVGAIVCLLLTGFSAIRGVSLMYLQTAFGQTEENDREIYFQKANALDENEPGFRYYYGLHLYNSDRPAEAVPHLKFAINKGIATSISYFNLASAQIISKQNAEAEKTLIEGLQVYPRSVFLRTAYASLLDENGKQAEAAREYETAADLNAAQAHSWRLAFAEGMGNLSQTEATDKQFVKAMELRPTDAIYALLDFQRQFRPNLVRR